MKSINICAYSLFACIAAASVPVANAGVSTGTFQVSMSILKSCAVTAGSASNINFGAQPDSATNIPGQSNISVKCTNTLPYFIGLAPSNNSTGGAGVMSSTAGDAGSNNDKVGYQLYQDAAKTMIWGNTATSTTAGNGVEGVGTGASQIIPVHALVAKASYNPDNYADTVTVTVNF